MQIEKDEVLRIAKLADLKIEEEKIEEYRKNLEEILDFANIINNVDTSNLSETTGNSQNVNFFREDEVKNFDNIEGLILNAPEKENNMFKIPKVI